MVVRGGRKYITVNGYPPQLFDLRKDPEETANVAGSREYAAVEKDLRARAGRGWDGRALKQAVLLSQQERALVRSMREYGAAPKWDWK